MAPSSSDAAAPAIRAAGAEVDLVPASAAIDRMLRRCPDMTHERVAETLAVALGRSMGGALAVEERIASVALRRERLRRLLDAPGIAQRTPDWYEARKTMVTASDIAQALGCAKFGTQRQFFEKKCSTTPAAFDATIPPLRWGIMFEPVACSIYSHLNCGVTVHEFGLLRHPDIPHLGASPDGFTEDGVMVEIKCPWRRKINGEVPLQYYYQIQGQLAVCGMDECDYFECEFEVVHSAADLAYHDGPAYERGVFLEDASASPPRYTYPPAELSDLQDLEAWASQGEGAQRVWWRLMKCATARLHADPALFADLTRRLEPVWGRVLAYRADPAAFDAEVSAPAAAAKTSRARKKKVLSDEPSIPEYAFVDLEDEPAAPNAFVQ